MNKRQILEYTDVTPFSNILEAMTWHDCNCDKCINYENKSQTEEDARCKLAFHIDKGFITGSIPSHVAKQIGCDYDPLHLTCNLHNKCKNMKKRF